MHRHMHPGSAELKELTEREIECFVRFQELLGAPMEVVRVPYGDLGLTGYFYRSANADGQAPTLIVHQGRDAWAEDCKYIADEAVRRGYNCLLIDGPGNGQALRRHDLPFRPDWEAFVTPTVDYLLARADVDPRGVILLGVSMGGFLAPRAAAHERRLRSIVTDPAIPPTDRLRSILRELLDGAQAFPNLSRAHLHGPIMEGDFDTVFARRFRAFLLRARDALAEAMPDKADGMGLRLAALFSAVTGWGLSGGMFADFPGAVPEHPECRAEYLELLVEQFAVARPPACRGGSRPP